MEKITMKTRKILLKNLRDRYLKASRREKSKILDEFTATTGHNRKYIIGKLNSADLLKPKVKLKKRGNQIYDEKVINLVEQLWKIFDYPCGQRLKFCIKNELDRLIRFDEITATEKQVELLKCISSVTIDRRLKPKKKILRSGMFSTTKPGYLLKKDIPVRLNNWDDTTIGFTEIDLVAHNGGCSSGQFINSLAMTDIASHWWEAEPIMGKSQKVVHQAIKSIKSRLPFLLLGIDSDNGAEFINDLLLKYCKDNNITFTRSRPYHKNDNAYIEGRNWTHIRKIIGYARHDTQPELHILGHLYTKELADYKNFFQPTYKLESKSWEGSKRIRKYEKSLKTPYQRLLDSEVLSSAEKLLLTNRYERLNPAALKRSIQKTLDALDKAYEYKHHAKTGS